MRIRRSAEESRELLMVTARDLFAARGFDDTSTREIAERSGVAEKLIFRHFGSKVGLFEEAVLGPFRAFVDQYVRDWEARSRGSLTLEQLTRQFVTGLLALLKDNRSMIVDLMAMRARRADSDRLGFDGSLFEEMFAGLERLTETEARLASWTLVDPPSSVRFTFGLVLAVAVFEEWLFPRGTPEMNRDDLVEELVRFVLQGVNPPPGTFPSAESRPGDISDPPPE